MRTNGTKKILAIAAASACIGIGFTTQLALAGSSGDAVTVSLSGSTAIRNFTISSGFTLLNPGSSITVNSGPGGAPVTYSATSTASGVQLAAGDFTSGVTANPGIGAPAVSSANYAAFRIEWHEQGSVEGITELADSQIDDLILTNTIYNPSSGNATYVNRNKFGGTSPSGPTPPATLGGHFLDQHPNSLTSRNANGQSRVQMAISDVNAVQAFSRPGVGAYNKVPGQAGYGKGNSMLSPAPGNVTGLGVAGARQQLQDEGVLNMSTSTLDPTTGASYSAGPWNGAGIDNLQSKVVVVSAMTLSANPGTGLARLNRNDAQFLQAAGRLANGADFNVATRDAGSGTRNATSMNVGLDPSFAVGEADSGAGASTESNIGSGIRFSGKTSGGSLLRPTVQNSRMSIGHLSIADAQSSAQSTASRPIRALDYRDDDNDLADGSNAAYGFSDPTAGTFVHISAQSIVNGSYALYQNQNYVTVKAPNSTFAGDSAAQWAARTDAETGIKGDNSGHDVADFRDNVFGSVANFPAGSIANPADAAIQNSLILPQFMQVAKVRDGVNQSVPNPLYNSSLSGQFLGASSLTSKFDVASTTAITKGNGSSYGNIANGSTGFISITDQNYLFGNFNQNGIRDYSSVQAALAAQAALGVDNDMFSGATANIAKVAGVSGALAAMTGSDGTAGATKGDLIAMGDMNSDGRFNGKDLYLLARGAALADSTATISLSAASGADLGDRLRHGVLRKNAALDYMDANATAQPRIDASANLANDPTGALAFKKVDVNRDGLLNLKDAKIVDYFAGADYRNLGHQVNAAVGADDDSLLYTTSTTFKPISLVDVEMNDTGNIDTFDFRPVRLALGSALKDGDTDFNGVVNFDDYSRTDNGFNTQGNPGFVQSWSKGDFDSNGIVNFDDYSLIDFAFNAQGRTLATALAWLGGDKSSDVGMTSPELQKVVQHYARFGDAYATSFLNSAVPEPGAVMIAMGVLGAATVRRRRRGS